MMQKRSVKNKIIDCILKLKNNKLFEDYIAVFLGQNIGSVFSVLSMIISLKIISSNEYGALVIIQTYCLLVSNVFCLRTFNGVIKYITEAQKNNNSVLVKQYINTAFLLDFAAGIIAFVFSFILLNPITSLMNWGKDTVTYVYMYIPVILFYPMLNGTPIGVLRQTGNFKLVNIIHAVVYGIQMLVLFITWATGFGNFQIVIAEYAITEAAESIILIITAICILQKEKAFKGFWKEGLTLNWPFIKYNFSYGILATFDQVLGNVSTMLINRFVGNLATAYLKIITKICSILSKLTNPIGQIIYPQFCSWITEKKYKKAFHLSKKYFIAVTAFGIIMLAIMYGTYDLWIVVFDSGMSNVKIQSMLYFIFSIFSMSIICIHQLSYALDMMKLNLLLIGILDIAYLIALIPCVKQWGVNGYLVLQIIQLVMVALGKYIYIKRKIKLMGN